VVHTLALAESLAAQGHSVDVWSLARGGDDGFFRAVDPAVGLRLVPFGDLEGETVGQRIVRSIAVLGTAFAATDAAAGSEGGYDIVHAQDCISANAVPRCIRTIHHLDTFTTPELQACHERAIVRPFAHLCVSAAVAAEVERGWGLRPKVIGNGIEAQRFADAASDRPGPMAARGRVRERLGRYVLAVGGIEPRKGTLDLIEAMALVAEQEPGLSLVIAGGETLFDYRGYREQVERRAAELGVTPVVLGAVPHEELPVVVAAAAVFAFPSIKEGFGLAAMEALAAGVPLVLRDLPVLHEVFGGAGQYASTPNDLARQLLAAACQPDPARAERGRTLAAAHRWDEVARAHVAFYREQLAREPARRAGNSAAGPAR
jgi:glycosyltransferase-like protein